MLSYIGFSYFPPFLEKKNRATSPPESRIYPFNTFAKANGISEKEAVLRCRLLPHSLRCKLRCSYEALELAPESFFGIQKCPINEAPGRRMRRRHLLQLMIFAGSFLKWKERSCKAEELLFIWHLLVILGFLHFGKQ